MGLNALKCIKRHIPPKGQKMPKNGKKCQKCEKITNNCKISEITKYCEKLQKLTTNVKKCQKRAKKRQKNGKISIFFQRFSGSKLPQKMLLAIFTRWLVPEMHIFGNFWLKSAFLGLNFSRTKEITAKPKVLS